MKSPVQWALDLEGSGMPQKQAMTVADVLYESHTAILESMSNMLTDLEGRLDAKLDTKLESLDTKLESRLESLDTKLESRLESLDTKLDTKLESLEARLGREIEATAKSQTRWMAAAWVVTVSIVVAMFGLSLDNADLAAVVQEIIRTIKPGDSS